MVIILALGIFIVPAPAGYAHPADHTIRVEASSFEFTPAELRVNPGDRVTIQLASTDVVHGLYLDGYGLEVVSDPGQTSSLTFVADRPGTFRFRCSITCGPMHPFMIGKLHVGPNWLFWKSLAAAILIVVAGYWVVRS